MKEIKSRSAGVVFLLEKDELPVEGKICFTAEELSWARICGEDHVDPEQQKSFWKTLLEKKTNDFRYSLFSDFPKATETLAEKYCREITAKLRGTGARTRMEKIKDEESA